MTRPANAAVVSRTPLVATAATGERDGVPEGGGALGDGVLEDVDDAVFVGVDDAVLVGVCVVVGVVVGDGRGLGVASFDAVAAAKALELEAFARSGATKSTARASAAFTLARTNGSSRASALRRRRTATPDDVVASSARSCD